MRPLDFDDPAGLDASLAGATTLYNTYWVRFAHGGIDHALAVENSRTLFHAARRAGVRKIVHVSILHPSAASPYPYFRGKALVERALAETGLAYRRAAAVGALRRARASCSTTSPGCCAGSRSSPSGAAATTECAHPRRRPGPRWRSRPRRGPTTGSSTPWAPTAPPSSSWSSRSAPPWGAGPASSACRHRCCSARRSSSAPCCTTWCSPAEEYRSMAEGLADSDADRPARSASPVAGRARRQLGPRYANELDLHFR